MKPFIMAICFVCLLLSLGNEFAHAAPPVLLTLAAPQPEIKKGSEVRVEVTITNNSNRPITLEITSPLCDYEVEVRDGGGNLAPDTDIKKTTDCANRTATGMNVIAQLRPHESQKDTIPITLFSDMSKPGKYSVQVTWKGPKEIGNVAVKSNKITVTVTE